MAIKLNFSLQLKRAEDKNIVTGLKKKKKKPDLFLEVLTEYFELWVFCFETETLRRIRI